MVSSEDETAWQPSIGDLGRPLSETVFVVIDLETSGGSPFAGAGITEIGAVKVCGGQVIGEFQSLVNPGTPIPDYITELTGISFAMIQGSPSIESILPMLFEFLGSPQTNILVAHNASFDIGFLKAAASQHSYKWPRFKVFDTVALARAVLSKDDVQDCKLATLSAFFNAETSPNHRALDDARATVDVLHGIFERFGSLDIKTVEDVMAFTNRVLRKGLN
jgi:DNA polymerase-3 subunit epsilon